MLKEENGKLLVTESRDFAGKAMTVTRTLAADSKEAKALQRKAASSSAVGIDAVLQQIEKRRRVRSLPPTRHRLGSPQASQKFDPKRIASEWSSALDVAWFVAACRAESASTWLTRTLQPSPSTQINVLDKTKMDWGEYKADQTVDVQADLEQHKKSGATHLEQADFLARADVRQYEIERDQRLASSARNRGRL